MPFSLSEVTFDLDMGQSLTVLRSQGAFGAGGWISTSNLEIPTFGIIEVASEKALQMIPEGDRVTGALLLFTQMPLYSTHLEPAPGPPGVPGPGLSDKIVWNTRTYSVTSIEPWKDFGYFAAILLRIAGN